MRRVQLFHILALAVGLAGLTPPTTIAADISVAELVSRTHIHGLAFDRTDPNRLFIATHHGLFAATGDGKVTEVSETRDDFMGFNAHPRDAATLYASGHPSTGGNLGFIRSDDAGRTWKQISPGADGPVDFHQLASGAGDPAILYGVFKGLQVSRDGGATWSIVGKTPEGLIDLAVSMSDPARIYAATETGLLVSRDGGLAWESLISAAPVTSIEATADGTLNAFVYGSGLQRANELTPDFKQVGSYEKQFLLYVTTDPASPKHMAAVTNAGAIVVSTDAGSSWQPLGPQQ